MGGQMRDAVVTVFGGSGFLGRHLIRRLALRGATIRVPTRLPDAAIHLRPMGAVGQIVLEPFAPAREGLVEALVEGSTHVVNLIGILFERKAGDFEALQGRLPGRIGKAAAVAGARRLVQISAIGADAASRSLYARSKAAGEAAAREAFAGATVLRPSIVFGPEDGFFNRFAEMARFLPTLPLIGGGTTRFQPVYVGDVAEAIVAALKRDDAPGRSYELGGPRVYTFKELMAYMLEVVGRRRLLLTLPYGIATLQARLLELLPVPPLTRDQVELLKRDNVVSPGALGLADLGVTPTPLEVIVPTYLRQYARWPSRLPVV
jgi:NADH dehydrogenase